MIREAALYGQSTQDADGIPLRYQSTLLRSQADYGETRAMLPRGMEGEMEEAKDFLRGLGQKVASRHLERFSYAAQVRMGGMETSSVLDGMPKRKVLDLLNRLMAPHTRGNFRDQYWTPIQNIRKEFEKEDIPAILQSAEYEHENGVAVRKVWLYEVPFTNQNGRPDKVYIRITAAGAGPVDDPLAVYDVTAYAS